MKPDCLRDEVYLWKWTENFSERLELSEPYHIIVAFNGITTCNNNDNNDNSNKLYTYIQHLFKSWFCALTNKQKQETQEDDVTEERDEHEEWKQDGRTENMKTPKVVNSMSRYK